MKSLITAGTAALALSCSAPALDIAQYIDVLTIRAKQSYGMELDNSPAEFDFTEISLLAFITDPIELGNDWSAIAYLDFRASNMSFDGNPLIGTFADDLETDLFRVGLPFIVYHAEESSPWTYGAWVSPAISSDFDHIDSDDIFVDAAIAVAYQFNDCLAIGAGIYAADIGRDAEFFPGVGFAWTPTDDWLVTFYGPRFIARREFNERHRLGVEVSTNGGTWNIDADNNSLKLNLRSWRAGLYYRYNFTGNLWLEASAGFTFANKLDLDTRGGTELFQNSLGEADSAPFAALAFTVNRW
ncbi:DUF6268 family outer membrane beta-barrel protein [Haloferula sp.]|uniref:DUF6268 family outer membrane beta-barrel protein n=1 Tax=Haloferula sp. TaxID=2497595 RepID=UPI00329ED356